MKLKLQVDSSPKVQDEKAAKKKDRRSFQPTSFSFIIRAKKKKKREKETRENEKREKTARPRVKTRDVVPAATTTATTRKKESMKKASSGWGRWWGLESSMSRRLLPLLEARRYDSRPDLKDSPLPHPPSFR